jgi:hypothetical protein
MIRGGWRAIRTGAAVAAIVCGAARSGLAAGEGFYCTGPDYLAYEFNGDGTRPGLHQLWVVNLGGASGASAPAAVDLDQFQTRGLRCLDRAVEVLGRTNVFVVALDPARQPQTPIPRPIAAHERPAGFAPPRSLGASAAAFASGDLPKRITLDTPGTTARFALEFTGGPHRNGGDRPAGNCFTDAETKLLQLDAAGAPAAARTLFKGIVVHKCAASDFDGESPNGVGAPLPAPACAAAPGRQAQRIIGEATEGADVTDPIGPFLLQLRSEGEDGWDLALLEPGRLDNLAQLTSPPHGPSPLDIFAWHFRNDDNTGPPAQANAPGGRHRAFIFSPELGRTLTFNLDTLADDRERAAAYGRGTFDILEYEMTPRELGESPRLLWMKFAACVTWPQ